MNKLGLLLTGIAALTAGVGVAILKKDRIDISKVEGHAEDDLIEVNEDARA